MRIEVDNRADVLHPGELVDVRLAVGDTGPQLAVPVEAVVLLLNQPTVFVAVGASSYRPAAVVTGPTRDGWITITRGLKPGDRYVREGAFALKARLLRSQLGEE